MRLDFIGVCTAFLLITIGSTKATPTTPDLDGSRLAFADSRAEGAQASDGGTEAPPTHQHQHHRRETLDPAAGVHKDPAAGVLEDPAAGVHEDPGLGAQPKRRLGDTAAVRSDTALRTASDRRRLSGQSAAHYKCGSFTTSSNSYQQFKFTSKSDQQEYYIGVDALESPM